MSLIAVPIGSVVSCATVHARWFARMLAQKGVRLPHDYWNNAVVHCRVSNSWYSDSTGIFIDLNKMITQFRLYHLLYSFYPYMLECNTCVLKER